MKNAVRINFAGNLKVSEYGTYLDDVSIDEVLHDAMSDGEQFCEGVRQVTISVSPINNAGIHIEEF